ncbi:DUF3993 domain-containing protein [Bacillus sp. FJAT-49736]|uniref:DUF3993 domain-containing protein n=1 Tax=Bacillus sp. FJAT-49736 TaxID=2833582 RepID=UPI001BC9947F|nr:DUF3993 domain-containing protein [Bacillus sp. FJAT-49736]MBS4172324.1 DUF3993 domain-containing protein [Bacillus sp. FJAT-49736]
MKKVILAVIIFNFIFFGFNSLVIAKEKSIPFKQFVQAAFHTQVVLSEKERSLKNVEEMLSNYFTKEFISQFNMENLVKTKNGYQTFGSDFPLYYIPFFSYDERTKVKKIGRKVYVYENMAKKDAGPVVYKNDYQGVRITNINGKWKIDEILYSVPDSILQPSSVPKKKTSNTIKSNSLNTKNNSNASFFLQPLTALIMSGNIGPFLSVMLR